MQLEVGDLVAFYSGFEPFNREYVNRNPGVILGITSNGGWGGNQKSATVLWANKDITSEFTTYLETT